MKKIKVKTEFRRDFYIFTTQYILYAVIFGFIISGFIRPMAILLFAPFFGLTLAGHLHFFKKIFEVNK